MPDRTQLVLSLWMRGEPVYYRCSACDQIFIPPEDRTAKEAMIDLMAAFAQDVSDEHSDVAPEAAGRHED
jgi:hypothetical protein